MQSNHPVPIESRALGTLSYIRSSIDAAGSLAVPGMAGIVMGSIGVAAISASTVTNARNRPLIASMGALFALLGSVTFVLPVATHTLALGAGFGALHLLFGVLIGRANHGE